MDKYVIAWQSKETRNEGQGTAHFDLETAQAICTEANQEYPFLTHWPKRVEFSTCDEETQPIFVDEVDTLLLDDLTGEG